MTRDNLAAYVRRNPRQWNVACIGAGNGTDGLCVRSPEILWAAVQAMYRFFAIPEPSWQVFHHPPGQRFDSEFVQVAEISDRVAGAVCQALASGQFALTLGGDHTTAIGSGKGFIKACMDAGEVPGLVWIDSHPDFNVGRSELDAAGTDAGTGKAHGMPLSILVGDGPVVLQNVLGAQYVVERRNVVLIGVNHLDSAEVARLRDSGITVITLKDCRDFGMHAACEAIDDLRRRTGRVMVSLDVDAGDSSDMPATPMVTDAGLLKGELHSLAQQLGIRAAGLAPVVALDLVEYYQPKESVDQRTIRTLLRFAATVLGHDYSSYEYDLAGKLDCVSTVRRSNVSASGLRVAIGSLAVVAATLLLSLFFRPAAHIAGPEVQVATVQPQGTAWGVKRFNPNGVGLRVIDLIPDWKRLAEGSTNEGYEEVRSQLIRTLRTELRLYARFAQLAEEGFYMPAGGGSELDQYNRDRAVSLMASNLYIALHRVDKSARGRIFTDALPQAFAEFENGEVLRRRFLQDYERFKTDVDPQEATAKLALYGLILQT